MGLRVIGGGAETREEQGHMEHAGYATALLRTLPSGWTQLLIDGLSTEKFKDKTRVAEMAELFGARISMIPRFPNFKKCMLLLAREDRGALENEADAEIRRLIFGTRGKVFFDEAIPKELLDEFNWD